MGRRKISENEKLAGIIGEQTVDTLNSLSRDELQTRIAAVESEIRDTELARENDQAIKTAAEDLKQLKGPYDEAVKRGRAIQRYAAIRIAELGG